MSGYFVMELRIFVMMGSTNDVCCFVLEIDDAFFQPDWAGACGGRWAGACGGRWAGTRAAVDWSEGSRLSGRR